VCSFRTHENESPPENWWSPAWETRKTPAGKDPTLTDTESSPAPILHPASCGSWPPPPHREWIENHPRTVPIDPHEPSAPHPFISTQPRDPLVKGKEHRGQSIRGAEVKRSHIASHQRYLQCSTNPSPFRWVTATKMTAKTQQSPHQKSTTPHDTKANKIQRVVLTRGKGEGRKPSRYRRDVPHHQQHATVPGSRCARVWRKSLQKTMN